MKKILSVGCAFCILLSCSPITQAADIPQQIDIAGYVEEYFHRADGTAFHFLDPTGWYGKEITETPDLTKFEGMAYLYADDLGDKYLEGDFKDSLLNGAVYSEFRFELNAGLSEQDMAAFDAALSEYAASRGTLLFRDDVYPVLRDFALRNDTQDALLNVLDEDPNIKAMISQISYTPVVFMDAHISTDNGLRFSAPDGDVLGAETLRDYAAENNLPWTVTDQGEVIPETASTTAVIEVLNRVSGAYHVMLKSSPLDESNTGVLNDDVRIVYQKGDLDGDGVITADDAVLALKGANEITAETEADARTLTPAQEAAGDVDSDGELTAFDAFCILKYFNLREVAEVEDLTWADVLPAK